MAILTQSKRLALYEVLTELHLQAMIIVLSLGLEVLLALAKRIAPALGRMEIVVQSKRLALS